jgi:hypothetical protein
MLDKGLASWGGGKPLGANKYLPVKKGSIAGIVVEDRRMICYLDTSALVKLYIYEGP